MSTLHANTAYLIAGCWVPHLPHPFVLSPASRRGRDARAFVLCLSVNLLRFNRNRLQPKHPPMESLKARLYAAMLRVISGRGFSGAPVAEIKTSATCTFSLSLWEVLPLKIRQEERLFSPAPSVLCPLLSQHPSPLVKPLPGGRASHQGQALWPGLPGNTAFTCIFFSPGGPSAAEARC